MYEEIGKSYKPLSGSLGLKEKHITDREANSFDSVLSIDDMSNLKSQFLADYRLGKDYFHVCHSGLINFCIPLI